MSKIDGLCELREQIINAFGKNEYNVGILNCGKAVKIKEEK